MQLKNWLLLSVLWTVTWAQASNNTTNTTTTTTSRAANSTSTANSTATTTANSTATTTANSTATTTTSRVNGTSTTATATQGSGVNNTAAATTTTSSPASNATSTSSNKTTTTSAVSTTTSVSPNTPLLPNPLSVTTTTTTKPTPTCNAASYAYSPSVLTGVVNQTKFDVSVNFLGNTSDSRDLAAKNLIGWVFACGNISKNATIDQQLAFIVGNNTITQLNSTVKSGGNSFSIPKNSTNCVFSITVNKTCVPSGMINVVVPAVNMTLPVSASDMAAAVNASNAVLNDPTASASSKLSTIANLATGIQSIASANASSTSVQANSNAVLQQLSTVVGSASQSDLASQAAAVIGSVNSLIATGSSGSSNVAQAASVLSSVLSSVANTSSIGAFSVGSGNSVASSMAAILQAPSSASSNVSSIVNSLNLLSQIAGSQATLTNPVTYADPAGLVSIMASVSLANNLSSVTNGNSTINVGTAFNSLLAGLSTTTVTSRAVSLAVNPYSTVTADSVNSSRSGVFQFSLFDDSNNPIVVQNLAQNFSMTFAMTPSMFVPAFPNATVVPACQYWSTTLSTWSTDGCYFDAVNSNLNVGICNCNHLTAFSVSLASITPNALDPVADAAAAAHAGLIYLVVGFMTGVWMIAIYYAWWTNRRSVLTLNGVVIEDFVAYKATITTDSNPHSSTSARTYITIQGSNGRSECLMFSHGMKAGSTVQKTIIALNVGTIESVVLSHDNTGGMVAWKVSEVTIQNVANGSGVIIDTPYNVPQAGVEMQASRVLYGESSFVKRFHSHVLVNMQERHLWVSTVTAPTTSRFSHTERLAVCFLLLFGNMGLGFWFHKSRSFTQDFLNVVIVAIITSGIMLVITLPLMYVFRSAQTGSLIYEQDAESQGKPTAQKGASLRWRHGAWVMTVVMTLGALALCALSALDLDARNVNSLSAALQSAAISIAESLFISSPLMAVGRSWWNARKNIESSPPAFTGNGNGSGKKQERSDANDRVVQATTTMEEQWSPESIYPSIDRSVEPPITTNALSSAIVPRNKNVRANTMSYGV